MANRNEVMNLIAKKHQEAQLLNLSLKLSVLDMVSQSTLSNEIDIEVENLLNRLNKHYLLHLKEDVNINSCGFRYEYEKNSNRYLYGVVPSWLSYITGEKQGNIELPEWFEREFRDQLPPVTGVAVFDFRNRIGKDC